MNLALYYFGQAGRAHRLAGLINVWTTAACDVGTEYWFEYMFEVFCCPSTTTKHTTICVCQTT